MKIKLLNDWILVELEPESEVSKGGIVVVGEQPIRIAKILAVGPGRDYGNKFIPMKAQVGERVAFFKAVMDTHQGKQFAYHLEDNQGLIRETDVLMVVDGDVRISA